MIVFFCSAQFANFLWLTFTRSNPSHDIYGINSFTQYKHWGCRSSLIIDARAKKHHAPCLEEESFCFCSSKKNSKKRVE